MINNILKKQINIQMICIIKLFITILIFVFKLTFVPLKDITHNI
jgi:hypothetical protein